VQAGRKPRLEHVVSRASLTGRVEAREGDQQQLCRHSATI
jgi:hypothetical protein